AWLPHVAAIASSASGRRATTTTDAPRVASNAASAAPMPLLAPVMTTTFESTLIRGFDLRLHELAERHDGSVNRDDAVDLQVVLLDVLDEIGRVRLHRGRRAEDIRLDEETLLREVRHQQGVGMRTAGDVVQVDRHRAVLQRLLFVHALDGQ